MKRSASEIFQVLMKWNEGNRGGDTRFGHTWKTQRKMNQVQQKKCPHWLQNKLRNDREKHTRSRLSLEYAREDANNQGCSRVHPPTRRCEHVVVSLLTSLSNVQSR